jgi:hypothetical protein
MGTFFSILIGGAITFLASWIYYRKASEDLRTETGYLRRETKALRSEADVLRKGNADLLRYSIMLLHFLDDAGVIDVEWDPDTGEPRRIVEISATATGRGTATADLTVIRRHEAQAMGLASHEAEVIRREDQEDGAPAEEAEDR